MHRREENQLLCLNVECERGPIRGVTGNSSIQPSTGTYAIWARPLTSEYVLGARMLISTPLTHKPLSIVQKEQTILFG